MNEKLTSLVLSFYVEQLVYVGLFDFRVPLDEKDNEYRKTLYDSIFNESHGVNEYINQYIYKTIGTLMKHRDQVTRYVKLHEKYMTVPQQDLELMDAERDELNTLEKQFKLWTGLPNIPDMIWELFSSDNLLAKILTRIEQHL